MRVVQLILCLVAPAGAKTTSAQADQYLSGKLDRTDLSSDPFIQFNDWFSQAQSASVYQPETVCLSTASLPSGAPSSRFVYLKELDSKGFIIYSNWATSRKAADIRSNPQASLAFWWRELERQVRVEGEAERLTKEESQRYFSLRARGSKIGAWASEQSSVLREEDGGRDILNQRVRDIDRSFQGLADKDIEVPDFWGGLRIIPLVVEFWQGRDNRLHDRFRYTRQKDESSEMTGWNWKIERLSP
ncbi:MAG: hypothetical protein LQ340_006250 [Diploschistes diacapsis]|nr:MAG: hypothetical protein LQ340_006250 [Diploschistes diacapsis]